MNAGGKYESIGQAIGHLVDEKNVAYGDAFNKTGEFLRILYPAGIRPDQYEDLLTITRIFDKLMRAATNPDALGENPFEDIAGYGILKAARRAGKIIHTQKAGAANE